MDVKVLHKAFNNIVVSFHKGKNAFIGSAATKNF